MFDLYTFNPWWQRKEVDAALKGKPREVFDQIYDYIDTRQIILLSGWLMEQYFINYLKAKFFYRNPQKEEIDLILEYGNNQCR